MSDPTATPARRPETLRELGYLFTFLRPYRLAFRGATAASLVSMTFGAAFPLLLAHPVAPVKVAVMVWLPTANAVVLNEA